MPVVAGAIVIALVALIFFFVKGTSDPAPTAPNLPDYSKMKPEEIMAAHGRDEQAQREAMQSVGKR